MAEVESMQEGTAFGGLENTYIEAIDGPREGEQSAEGATADGKTVEATEQSSEADATEQTETTEQPSYSKDALVNELIGKFAKDHPELDPANPAHLKILNRMAHQEKMIRGLKATTARPDHLTDYERSTLNPKEEQVAQLAQQQTQQTQPAVDGEEIGANWKRPEDAYSEIAQAWSKEGGPDLPAVNKGEVGLFAKRISAFGLVNAEQTQAIVERIIQERLGDVLPNIRETVEMQISQQNKDFALSELAKSPEWESIADLETEIDGEPLVYAGESFPNTALNRVLIDNPEILDINVTRNAKGQLLSKKDSERLTYMARFRAAGRISKQGQMENGKVKQVFEAGQKQAARENGDRVRQGLNGGKGATGLPNGKKTGSLVHELVNDGGPRSFSSF